MLWYCGFARYMDIPWAVPKASHEIAHGLGEGEFLLAAFGTSLRAIPLVSILSLQLVRPAIQRPLIWTWGQAAMDDQSVGSFTK